MPKLDKHTPNMDKPAIIEKTEVVELEAVPVEEAKKGLSVDWTKVVIAFFAWVIFPIILIIGFLEYQRRKHTHKEKLAGVDNENKKIERRNNMIGQLGRFALSVFDKVASYF